MNKIGVIDIGTNTIRAVGYTDDIKPICEKVFESNILKHTKDGILSIVGIKELNLTIQKEIEFFNQNGIFEIYAFATSAMRDVKNFDEVNQYCDTEIELLSEEDEAMCDFYALKNELGDISSGVGIDLGGGSCQIIVFDEGKVRYFSSFPIGVKRLYNKFGKYKSTIFEYIKEVIKDVPNVKSEYLYVMGGTGKTINKILNGEITVDALDNEKPPFNDEKCYDGFREMSKNTVPYGVDVISVIAKKFSAKKIKILNCGSRDGFVVKKR